MNYAVNNYKHLNPIIDAHIKRNLNIPLEKISSEIAVMTCAPVLVVCYLLLDLGYDSVKLRTQIDMLTKFYKATVSFE